MKLRPLRLLPLLPLLALPFLLSSGGCARGGLTAPELYERDCARCHGDNGQGVARGLRTYPRLNLLDSPMVSRGDRAAVRQRIAEGHGPMPGFRRRLTPQEIERLTDFTFHLKEKR